MKKILPILLAGLCVPAAAQDFGAVVNGAMAQLNFAPVPQVVAQSARRQKMNVALDSAMTAMNDGPEIGGQVVSFVRDQKVEIRFEDQQPLSRTDGKAIVLDVKMSAYPRAIGPRVAWEAAAMMLVDMPECAEKQYMRRSIAARAWLELGGEPSKLPVIEPLSGDKDPELAREMKLWLDNGAELALDKIGEATKTKSVLIMMDEERDPAKREALKAANKRFTDFLIAEQQWKQSNPR